MSLFRPRRTLRALAVAALVATPLVAGGAASATPPGPGVTATVLWERTVGETHLVLRDITIPPGQSTGWHYHDGTLYGLVEHGTLSHFDSSCEADGVYHAGQRLTEPSGPAHVHIGRNLGRTAVELRVLYVLPVGSPYSEDAPNPGCDFQ